MPISKYITEIDKIYKKGNATEHTYRGTLTVLLESLGGSGIVATNEPTRTSCGAPDYIITRKDIPLGYVEAKDIGKDLNSKSYTEQFDRYKNSLNNLIITDYLDFQFYKDGGYMTHCAIAEAIGGKITPLPQNFDTFKSLMSSFYAYKGQSIKSADKLAESMADKARLLGDVIKKALHSKDDNYENKTLKGQLEAFRKILIHDLDVNKFADIYAQTIAYGMFAGRLYDITLESFSRQEACECIPKSNPFLRSLFGYIAGPDIDDRIKWIVDDLAELFSYTDVAVILKNFGKATKMQDPIIHFYETFLSEYDPKLRKSRGVWYTPQPVVNFIVRAVDELLQSAFGLSGGLADTTKTTVDVELIGKATTRKTGTATKTTKKEIHKVQVLDPATGTGTFLSEVIRQIHAKYANMQGVWNSYIDEHLLPRVHGFELLMASYAMAHLKLDMLLQETGYAAKSNRRLGVYLTNSLEEAHPDTGTLFATWLAQEATEANYVKQDVPVMVVLGNPPYSGESANKGSWIMGLLDAYKKEASGEPLKERNPKWINDDYVKFIRYAEHYIEKNQQGIVAYINNHSFLDNPTFRGMRWHLLNTFDKIYIINLHGNAKKKETAPDGSKDENVFDIMQGVSINVFVKTNAKKKKQLADVYYCDLWGKRETKYEILADNSLAISKFIMKYPPYTITKSILNLVAQISELLGQFQAQSNLLNKPQLRRINRIRSIHASLAIENNTLTLDEVTAVIGGKKVLAPPREVQEVQGAFAAYEQMEKWNPANLDDLLAAHAILMQDLVNVPGQLRTSNVGVFSGKEVIHMAPPAAIAKEHLQQLLNWIGLADEHPLVASSIFHYEFEFLHPFEDGNGRMGRLWQTLILSKWKPILAYLPVESVIKDKQAEYYAAIADSNKHGEATIFVEFVLQALHEALTQVINADQVNAQVSGQVKALLKILVNKEIGGNELMHRLSLQHKQNFRQNYLNPALEAGLVERTQPDSPRSPTQKYRLTSAGKSLIRAK